jgi:hypothetical protein
MARYVKVFEYSDTALRDNQLGVPSAVERTNIVGDTAVQTLTNKTMSGAIASDTKRCSAQVDRVSSTTLTNITGLTGFSLVAAATYAYDIDLQVVCTANSGINVAFKYTTLTLTSIQSANTAVVAAGLAYARTTTATDQFLLIDSAAVVLNVRLTGTMVVNAAGTLDVQIAQKASHGDTTSAFVGSTATFTRTA